METFCQNKGHHDPHEQQEVVRSPGSHEVMTSIIILVNRLAQDVSNHHPMHV